ncbi:MAG: sulfite exporter TauE/SafE family protein [Geminicoccaceae bacterium]
MTDFVLATVIVAVAAFVQAAVGIGFAMVAVPLLALIDLGYVPGASLFAMLGLSLVMVWRGWGNIDGEGLSSLLPGLGVGTAVGALFLGSLPASAMGLIFGGAVLIGLMIGQLGLVLRRSVTSSALSGVIAGLMGTMAGIHGPALVVIYQNTAPRNARATIALIFVIGSTLSLVSLYLSGLFGLLELLMGLTLWPGVLIGYVLAIGCGHRISDIFARRVMLGLAALSALLLITTGF